MKRMMIATVFIMLVTACASGSVADDKKNEMIVTPETKPIVDAFHIAPVIRSGEYVFISGIPAALPDIENASPEEIKAAIKRAYQTAFYMLGQAGATKNDIVDITTFHTNLKSTRSEIVEVHKELFDLEPYPAWTVVGVDALFMDTAFFEIKLTARIQ